MIIEKKMKNEIDTLPLRNKRSKIPSHSHSLIFKVKDVCQKFVQFVREKTL